MCRLYSGPDLADVRKRATDAALQGFFVAPAFCSMALN
ncbi:hypothetical protein BN2475_750016 [Paraburkholderia ribeironis]|uniref:Uncharacterized protein n=1 Tax=Paraburkholderia ribeironis TaxID=1247936 RepID=A0A1N7SJD5_9BURK|nr:hypothetical protein BN2475_750016 [Paraburkholderia ribeironis]